MRTLFERSSQANLAEVSQSQAHVLFKLDLCLGGQKMSILGALMFFSQDCSQPTLGVPLPASKALHRVVLRVQWESCGLGKGEKF